MALSANLSGNHEAGGQGSLVHTENSWFNWPHGHV